MAQMNLDYQVEHSLAKGHNSLKYKNDEKYTDTCWLTTWSVNIIITAQYEF